VEAGASPPQDSAPAGRGAARNTLFSFLTQMSTAAFTAALTLYLVRALGPRQFGVFSLAVSVGALLYLPSDFGISNSASRFIAERRGDESAIAALLADALRLKLLISGALSAVLIVLAGPIASAYGVDSLEWPLRWIAIAVLGQSLVAFYRYAFLAIHEGSIGFQIVFGEAAVETAASVVFVATVGGAAAAGAGRASGYAAGSIIALALTLRRFGRRAFGGGHRLGDARRRLARYAAALFAIDAAYSASIAMAPILIGGFLGPKAVGLYQAPSRLIVLLQYPGISVGTGVAPSMARGENREPDVRTYSTALRYMIVFQAVLVAPILVWGGPIVRLTLGPKYAESARLLKELTPYIYLSGLNALVALGVNFLGVARSRLPIAIADFVVTASLTAVLLPTIGLDGAAWAADVVPLFYVPAHIWIIRRLIDLPLRPLFVSAARGLLAAAAMALVLLAFGTSHLSVADWLAGGVLSIAAFVATLVLTREVTFAELRALPRALTSLRRSG
jgi:O-antigen/teichoic acid export membrane protein